MQLCFQSSLENVGADLEVGYNTKKSILKEAWKKVFTLKSPSVILRRTSTYDQAKEFTVNFKQKLYSLSIALCCWNRRPFDDPSGHYETITRNCFSVEPLYLDTTWECVNVVWLCTGTAESSYFLFICITPENARWRRYFKSFFGLTHPVLRIQIANQSLLITMMESLLVSLIKVTDISPCSYRYVYVVICLWINVFILKEILERSFDSTFLKDAFWYIWFKPPMRRSY